MCVCVCARARIDVCMHVCVYPWTGHVMCVRACAQGVCLYVCMYVCMYVWRSSMSTTTVTIVSRMSYLSLSAQAWSKLYIYYVNGMLHTLAVEAITPTQCILMMWLLSPKEKSTSYPHVRNNCTLYIALITQAWYHISHTHHPLHFPEYSIAPRAPRGRAAPICRYVCIV